MWRYFCSSNCCSSGTAIIYINGEVVGQTPLEVNLDPGTYEIEMIKEGYEEYRFSVELEKDKTRSVSIQLLPLTSKSQADLPTSIGDFLIIICCVLILAVILIFFQKYRTYMSSRRSQRNRENGKLSTRELRKLRRKLDEDYVEDRISRKEYLERRSELDSYLK